MERFKYSQPNTVGIPIHSKDCFYVPFSRRKLSPDSSDCQPGFSGRLRHLESCDRSRQVTQKLLALLELLESYYSKSYGRFYQGLSVQPLCLLQIDKYSPSYNLALETWAIFYLNTTENITLKIFAFDYSSKFFVDFLPMNDYLAYCIFFFLELLLESLSFFSFPFQCALATFPDVE